MYKLFVCISMMTAASFAATAQERAKPAGDRCTDTKVLSTLVALRESDEAKGLKLKMFESFSMPHNTVVPFAIEMEQGKLYDMHYVVNEAFSRYDLVILDKDKKKIVNERVKNEGGTQSYKTINFVAPYTGKYVVVLTQKNKTSAAPCGGFVVLQAASQ